MKEESRKRAMEMFEMRLDGATYQEIADKYGITRQCVQQTLVYTPKRNVVEKVVYKGLRDWMRENNVSFKRFHKLISPDTLNHNSSLASSKLKGEREFKLSEIILIIKESGLTFEELFMNE